MDFLNSILLFGAAGTLVPLLIHLFQRRRVRRLEFPSLRFLSETNRRQMRRLNLRRLLLLILRMLLVLTVALALARPALRGVLASVFPEGTPRSVALLLDRSASMGLETEAGSLSELAAGRAREILSTLGDADEARLYAFEERLFDLGGGPLDAARALALLEDWEGGEGPTATRACLAEALEALRDRPQPLREIFVLSDFAAATLDSAALPDPGETRVYALPLGESAANAGLAELERPLRPLLPGRSFTLRLGAEAEGGGDAFPVDLEVDGRYRGSLSFQPDPGALETREFKLSLEGEGVHEGSWRKKRDRFAADDRLDFVLPLSGKLEVLLLGGGETARALARALDPYEGQGRRRLALNLRRRAAEALVSADLEGAHLAVLAGGEGLSEAGAEELAAFVARGGGLLVFPDGEDLADLRRLLPRLDGPRALTLRADRSHRLGSFAEEHPLFAGLGDEHLRILARQSFSTVFGASLGAREALARFESGLPALMGWNSGRGRVRLALFGVDPAGSDLPLSSMFLPLVQEMAQEAAGIQQPDPVRVGEALSWTLAELPPEGVRLDALSPDGRRLPLRLDATSFPPRALLDRADRSGFWRLREHSAAGSRELAVSAVRLPRGEGRLRPLPADSLAAALGLPALQVVGIDEPLEPALRAGHYGREIALWLLLVAAALMLAELWLGRRGPEGESV